MLMSEYDGIIDCVRALAHGGQPATDISKLLYEHNCFYLLSKIKTENEYTLRFKRESFLNQICIRERYATCQKIFKLFREKAIPYAVIKGTVLSQELYGGIHYRKSGDIDLLVSRNHIDEIKRIILENGFIQGRVTEKGLEPFTRRELLFQTTMSHQAAPFIKETGNPLCPYINVDINMDILWGESSRKADMDFVLKNTLPIPICGIAVPKLFCEMEFISLCLHHYKDMNSIYLLCGGSLKLSLFCDIYFYVIRCRPDIKTLKAICEQLDVSDYIYYCLYYTNQIFADDVLNPYLNALHTSKSDSILNVFGLAKDEIRTWDISFAERLFLLDFNQYFSMRLSAKDLEKIRINLELM